MLPLCVTSKKHGKERGSQFFLYKRVGIEGVFFEKLGSFSYSFVSLQAISLYNALYITTKELDRWTGE